MARASLAASTLSASNPAYQGWRDACQELELLSSDLSDRVAALDAFLDQVDESLELLGTRPMDHVDVELDAGEVLLDIGPLGLRLQQVEQMGPRAEPDFGLVR